MTRTSVSIARIAAVALAALLAVPLTAHAEPLGPAAPEDVTALAGPAPGEATVTWSASSSLFGISAYRVYRGVESGALDLVAEVPGDATSYVDQALPAGATLYYAVSAVDVVGEGPRSAEVAVTTFSPPSAPTGVAAAPGAGPFGEAVVSWSAPESDGGTPILAYHVYRNGEWIATVGADAISYADSGLLPLHDYAYSVSAANAVGEGPASASSCTMASPWVASPDAPSCLGLA